MQIEIRRVDVGSAVGEPLVQWEAGLVFVEQHQHSAATSSVTLIRFGSF